MHYNGYNILINNYLNKMPPKTEITLQNFFIFNSTLCHKEGEEENKILHYYPSAADTDSKVRNVGLVEAVIKFTGTFNTSESCNSLHTQKTRQVYYEPERNYWMAMTVNIPYICKSKDGSEYYEYQGDDIQDSVYLSVLKQAYKTFRLFNSTFISIVKYGGISTLKQSLENFFPQYLLSIKLTHCDILNVFGGIQYLPLNNLTFLNVLCFVNQIETDIPQLKYTSFMYNDHLVWSGIKPNNFQIIYQHMVSTLLPEFTSTELKGGSIPRDQTSPFSKLNYGRFATGPSSLKEGSPIGKVPKVYINNETFYLIIYRSLSASVILFVDGTCELTLDLFKKIDSMLGPELSSLVSDIADYCSSQAVANPNTLDNSPKFVYFNQLNLAYKSTVHNDNRQSGNISISQEALKIIADMNSDNLSKSFYGETVVKTVQDYWVIGKFSNRREFYVAIHNKNAALIEINEEVKKLCDAELKGIFFQT